MGLDVSHDAWHGAYSAFARWRTGLSKAADIPLDLLEGHWAGHTAFGSDEMGERVFSEAMQWAAPRDGGPLCGSPNGPLLYRYIEKIDQWLPLKWESLRPDVLHVLLDHSDGDGEIAVEYLPALADRLEELLPLLPEGDGGGHIGDWREKTQAFIDGCRLAASQNEPLEFR